jgi:hypothetical protein
MEQLTTGTKITAIPNLASWQRRLDQFQAKAAQRGLIAAPNWSSLGHISNC